MFNSSGPDNLLMEIFGFLIEEETGKLKKNTFLFREKILFFLWKAKFIKSQIQKENRGLNKKSLSLLFEIAIL